MSVTSWKIEMSYFGALLENCLSKPQFSSFIIELLISIAVYSTHLKHLPCTKLTWSLPGTAFFLFYHFLYYLGGGLHTKLLRVYSALPR